MANLDSSWQASVIKLAQTGNSRAIAFWLNRELVPQGVCAQVATESGTLVIQIVSRQAPDCERLVRFICHRLCQLNLTAVQQVRITAQKVGSSAVLWEKTARLPAQMAAQVAARQPVAAQIKQVNPDPSSSATLIQPPQATANLAPTELLEQMLQISGNPVSNNPVLGNPVPDNPVPDNPVAGNPAPIGPVPADPVPADPVAAKRPKPSSSSPNGRPTGKPAKSNRFRQFWQKLARPASPQPQISLGPTHLYGSLTRGLTQQISACKTASLEATDHSIRWFVGQKPATQVLVLGGSAAVAFLIGCGFELSGYAVKPPDFQTSKAALTGILRTVVPSGSVQTAASDRIAVTRQAVPNPDDPSIRLIFTNSAGLTRLPASQRQLSSLGSNIPLVTPIEAYRQADMTISNLNQPIASQATAPAKPLASSSPSPQLSQSGDEEELKLNALPADTDLPGANVGDHENEKMNFIEQEAQPEESNAATEDVQPDQPLTPQELVANGVDLVNLASSSIMPEGTSQLANSLDLLKQGNIHAIGAGESLPEARRPQVFDVKGQRIAYLGYSDSSPRAANGVTAGVNVSVLRQMQEDIKAIRDQVGWVVVSFNWNRELRAYPEDWQIELAHAAIDAGADLVVGYHPTMTQGAEIYSGRAIVYSLGASVNEDADYSEKPKGNYEAAALQVTLKEHVMELQFLPIRVKRGLAELAQGTVATKISQYLQQASSLFDQPMQSPTSINSQLRLSLPSAPDSTMPTEPFISYPAPSPQSNPQP